MCSWSRCRIDDYQKIEVMQLFRDTIQTSGPVAIMPHTYKILAPQGYDCAMVPILLTRDHLK
jgi:hypothetical protein